MQVTCFHNPNEENGYLSNWYLSQFTVAGTVFSSMEQYMMYSKAVCFRDKRIASQIMGTDDVGQIKAMGRQVSGYNDNIWNGVRQLFVYEGLYAKFSQNEELKRKLLNTRDSVLAECAVKDRIWGIGLSMHDPNRFDPSKWNGQNLLGYTLMMVRDKLCERADKVLTGSHRVYSIPQLKAALVPIFEEYGVRKATIFGAYGCGTATEASDIDILVDSGLHGLRFVGLFSDLTQKLGKEVNLVDVTHTQAEDLIELQVQKAGIIIYEDDRHSL